jgi:RNA polymerase sigma factor (sigma-70 family)
LVFVKASAAERKPVNREEMLPWLNEIAKNVCLDLVRKRRGHLIKDLDEPKTDNEASAWDRIADRTVSIEERLAWKQLLKAAATTLDAQERMAIELVHGDGFKRREAGLLIGLANPYPVIKSAERKMIEQIRALAYQGDKNAKGLIDLLGEAEKDGNT